jgi:hypothetical protein
VFSAHQMGTCRMGRDARSAVCDERGEVFGAKGLYVADASLFPMSSGVNPMVTVMGARPVCRGGDRVETTVITRSDGDEGSRSLNRKRRDPSLRS